VLVGAPPPRLPPQLSSGAANTAARRKKEQEHAAYFTALFVPWSARDAVEATPESWHAFLQDLEITATKIPETVEEDNCARVAQGRLFCIEQGSNTLTSRTKKNNVMTRWRFRSRTLWDEQEQGAQAAGGPQRDDAEKEIADIRKEAAQRGDPKALRRAAEMESWAEDNFAALEKLQNADHATQTWPARAPKCDGATALVLPDGPAGLRNMLDEIRCHGSKRQSHLAQRSPPSQPP